MLIDVIFKIYYNNWTQHSIADNRTLLPLDNILLCVIHGYMNIAKFNFEPIPGCHPTLIELLARTISICAFHRLELVTVDGSKVRRGAFSFDDDCAKVS